MNAHANTTSFANTDIIIDNGRKRYERVNVRQQSGCQRVI